MTLLERLKGVGIATVLILACVPAAVAATLLTSRLWSWIERRFGIEAYGHSGPAEWCYLVSYGVVLSIATLVWVLAERRRAARRG